MPISLVTLSSRMQPVSSHLLGQQMKAFEFPLQAALKLRRHRQDLAHRRFAVLQSQYNSAHDQLRHYQRLLSLAEQTAQSAGEADVDVVALLNYDVYRRRMTEQIDEQSELCRRLRGELTQARRDLMEACREQQRLQILRDSHYEQYCRELAALENKQLDEAGVQAWHMRGSGSLALNLSAPEPRDAG